MVQGSQREGQGPERSCLLSSDVPLQWASPGLKEAEDVVQWKSTG